MTELRLESGTVMEEIAGQLKKMEALRVEADKLMAAQSRLSVKIEEIEREADALSVKAGALSVKRKEVQGESDALGKDVQRLERVEYDAVEELRRIINSMMFQLDCESQSVAEGFSCERTEEEIELDRLRFSAILGRIDAAHVRH